MRPRSWINLFGNDEVYSIKDLKSRNGLFDYLRRKFRSQTSNNMDRRKKRGDSSQRRERARREELRRERVKG